ncbi:MAG: GrpB family protein [Chitinophagaceae bacterium]|nr:GrpB family protein [Chitinophagaceae bacterium]
MKDLLQPYNPEWKTGFENLKAILSSALKDFETVIEHVGSTAIPGLCAKPILDIDIITDKKDQLAGIAVILEKLGYKNKGEQGIAGRYAFRQTSGLTPFTANSVTWPEHHLYVCYSDSIALKNHILFRDVLRQDKDLAHKYALLKTNLVNRPGMKREIYTQLKTDFILEVLAANGFDEKDLSETKNANI